MKHPNLGMLGGEVIEDGAAPIRAPVIDVDDLERYGFGAV
jgi:hypothetical protein